VGPNFKAPTAQPVISMVHSTAALAAPTEPAHWFDFFEMPIELAAK
jgi:hypothetical protein